jgi:hypothetical protein
MYWTGVGSKTPGGTEALSITEYPTMAMKFADEFSAKAAIASSVWRSLAFFETVAVE